MAQTRVGEICWNELATTDVKKAKEFYSNVFGWQFKNIESPEMTYTVIESKDKEFGGIWQIPTEMQKEIPPHWMAYISVENIEESLKQAKIHGATEIKGITPAGDMGVFAIITDPTGAHIALWESSKPC